MQTVLKIVGMPLWIAGYAILIVAALILGVWLDSPDRQQDQ